MTAEFLTQEIEGRFVCIIGGAGNSLDKLFGKPNHKSVNERDGSSEPTLFYVLNLYKLSTFFVDTLEVGDLNCERE